MTNTGTSANVVKPHLSFAALRTTKQNQKQNKKKTSKISH